MLGGMFTHRMELFNRTLGARNAVGVQTMTETSLGFVLGRLEMRGRNPGDKASTEVGEGFSFTVDDWAAFLPVNPVTQGLTANGVIKYEGKTYEVIGTPQPKSVPGVSGLDHYQVFLRLIGTV